MARIFWVVCPDCKRKFYAATADFKGKDRKMMCPFCKAKFTDDELSKTNDSNLEVSS